jgi:hypothetical protein
VARYVDIRGFLDLDFDDVPKVRAIVETFRGRGQDFDLSGHIEKLYLSGWHYQTQPINWVAHVFYGANVQLAGRDFVQSQLSAIASTVADVEGYFHLNHEEWEAEVWRIGAGGLSSVPENHAADA